ncbi:MAG: aminoacetone oxidase family FAD-binding enzyme [bacterium]
MENKFDLIIIGGGAAGLVAAISAYRAHPTLKIAVIDRSPGPGRKILVCGAGRCNLTNVGLKNKPADKYYGQKSNFINQIFGNFGFGAIHDFFAEIGIPLIEDKKEGLGKVYPLTHQSSTVRDLLYDECLRNQVEFFLETNCDQIFNDGQGFQVNLTSESGLKLKLSSEFLILAAGGQSYPQLGANGSGFTLAESLGHQIITPVPVAVPLEAKNALSQLLQNVHQDVQATAVISSQDVKTINGEIIFTKYGFSGPAILNLSHEFSVAINRNQNFDTWIKFNFLPQFSAEQLKKELIGRWKKRPLQQLLYSLYGLLPDKFALRFPEFLKIAASLPVQKLSLKEINKLLSALQNTRFQITGTKGWENAEFTAGGIDTREIQPQTMQSKLIKNFYLAGEVVDIDGMIGGYNLSWAFASGWVAGLLKKK